jgi:outer membrane protein OmpA-like peptidoglycan-associated protein/uncharacterized protein YidB (DUF937 family)
MFDELVNEAASRLSLPAAGISDLVRGLLALITNDRTGGPEGFADMFRRAGLGDVFTSWFSGKEGATITASDLETTLGTERIEPLATISGLTRASTTSAIAFLLPKLIGLLTPDGVFSSGSPLLSRIPDFAERQTPTPTPARTVARRGRTRWLPWAAAALLAFAGWLWLRGPAGTLNPQLVLSNRDGKVTYAGVVRDEATRTAIVNALRTTFGEASVSGDLSIDRHVKRASWLPRLGDLVSVSRTPGVDLSINGDAIRLGGWLSPADRQTIADRLGGVVGSEALIGTLDDAAGEAARAANEQAVSALRVLGTSGVAPAALVHAMNLSIINFPTGSAQIPPDSVIVIRTSAEAIKRAPGGTTIEIAGHTDNTGDPAANLALSEARAEAVRNALVEAGAPPAVLTTKGYGDSRPRASNDTELGRFQNRRIEYSVTR